MHIKWIYSSTWHTCSMRCLSCMKLSFEKARKVPPIVTESGITLNASPPWNFATVTTCGDMLYINNTKRIVAINKGSHSGNKSFIIYNNHWLSHRKSVKFMCRSVHTHPKGLDPIPLLSLRWEPELSYSISSFSLSDIKASPNWSSCYIIFHIPLWSKHFAGKLWSNSQLLFLRQRYTNPRSQIRLFHPVLLKFM